MTHLRSIHPVLVLLAAILTLPSERLAAQTCLGPPARPGEVAFMGDRGTRGVTTSYGGRFQANLGGTVALGAGFSVDTFDDLSQNGFTSRVSVGLPRSLGILSACPVLGLEYSEVTPRSERGEGLEPLSNVTVAPGVGLGLGGSVVGGSLGVHVRPVLLLVFGEHARVRGARGEAAPPGSVQGGVEVGGVLRWTRVFVGVETVRTTLDGDPAVSFHVGLIR